MLLYIKLRVINVYKEKPCVFVVEVSHEPLLAEGDEEYVVTINQ
jgi:hypothetical protein